MTRPSDVPDVDHLCTAIDEQERLLTGPDVSPVLRVRICRALRSARDLLELSSTEPVREVAARTVAWLAESVGAFQRLPDGFAGGHAVAGKPAPLLRIVDDLDLLGLTLDLAHDATHRADQAALDGQLDLLRERFSVRTRAAALLRTAVVPPADVDRRVVRERGLEVGEDGIPRVPVPVPATAEEGA